MQRFLCDNYELHRSGLHWVIEELLFSRFLGFLICFVGCDGTQCSLHVGIDELKAIDITSIDPTEAA